MSNFITKLDYTSDNEKVMTELHTLLATSAKWEPDNQIGLRHRVGSSDQWTDSTGSLIDRISKIESNVEADFSIWNDDCPQYTREILEHLAHIEGVTWGRVRFMRSMKKTGLSMHYDKEPRYHLILRTNPNAIFGECFKNNPIRSTCYHLPADTHWYKVDTTREHFVYNGGWDERIHLVACPAA